MCFLFCSFKLCVFSQNFPHEMQFNVNGSFLCVLSNSAFSHKSFHMNYIFMYISFQNASSWFYLFCYFKHCICSQKFPHELHFNVKGAFFFVLSNSAFCFASCNLMQISSQFAPSWNTQVKYHNDNGEKHLVFVPQEKMDDPKAFHAEVEYYFPVIFII